MTTSTSKSNTTPDSNSNNNNKNEKKKTSSSAKDGNRLLVAMVDPTVTNGPQEVYAPVRLKCPHSGEERDYLLLTANSNAHQHHLLEIQILSSSTTTTTSIYASWFVGNRVVSNGHLHVLTRVDPLFWVLPSDPSNGMSTQWQPLDQLLASRMCATLQQVLDPRQLPHLCDSYEMDEEVFYKFSKSKTLAWLTQKQRAVQAVLIQQLCKQKGQEEKNTIQEGGAFAADFCLGTNTITEEEKVEDVGTTTNVPTEAMKDQAKRESMQVVCNYLSAGWRTAFLEHLEGNEGMLQDWKNEDVDSAKKAKLVPTPVDCYAATVTPAPSKEEKSAVPKLSFGQKQLLKVNKKGMKSMTSFFNVKKKE